MRNPICRLALSPILLSVVLLGCEDLGVPPPILPSIVSFAASPKSVLEGGTVLFTLRAAADIGLARGIIDYHDGTKRDTATLSGNRDSAQASHAYLIPGIFRPTLTLEDVSGHKAIASDSVYVGSNQLPRIIYRLTGSEGTVSRAAKRGLASDSEGDSLTISVSPVSPGLIFQMNARNDSVIYYLTDRDDNGTKRGKITVIDQKNRTVEQVVDIVFAPLDDISGSVHDRFEGTYLASCNPAVVMQRPLTGWVTAITGTNTVRVSVDASGKYAFPKVSSANHTLRAFITNGTDSSFIATYQLSPGDQTFDIGVETNAGTGMSLDRLLTMYQIVNFRSRDGMASAGVLTGINLRHDAVLYKCYLMGKDTSGAWFHAKHFTSEQQDWLENEIHTRCFAHIPPALRPVIMKGGPNDPAPVTRDGTTSVTPLLGYIIIYANLIPQVTDGEWNYWDQRHDGVYSSARVSFNGGDAAVSPFGFSLPTLVHGIGASISGNGLLQDPYYATRSTRAEHTTLDKPSIADMKLDWQVILEAPRYNNHIEEKYFVMPE
jgi:hypothetical protein